MRKEMMQNIIMLLNSLPGSYSEILIIETFTYNTQKQFPVVNKTTFVIRNYGNYDQYASGSEYWIYINLVIKGLYIKKMSIALGVD